MRGGMKHTVTSPSHSQHAFNCHLRDARNSLIALMEEPHSGASPIMPIALTAVMGAGVFSQALKDLCSNCRDPLETKIPTRASSKLLSAGHPSARRLADS